MPDNDLKKMKKKKKKIQENGMTPDGKSYGTEHLL